MAMLLLGIRQVFMGHRQLSLVIKDGVEFDIKIMNEGHFQIF